MNSTLNLTLKKHWFDLIASGEKTQEYRQIKTYWDKRLFNRSYNTILFKNGYGANVPSMTVELKGIRKGKGNEAWGADPNEDVYILELGPIITKSTTYKDNK